MRMDVSLPSLLESLTLEPFFLMGRALLSTMDLMVSALRPVTFWTVFHGILLESMLFTMRHSVSSTCLKIFPMAGRRDRRPFKQRC